MPFANSIVGGTILVRPAIRSPDYVQGVSGWTINRDGTVEFSNGTFRGTVQAAQIVGSVFGTSLTDPSLWLNENNANTLRVYDDQSNLVLELGAGLQANASAVFYDPDNPMALSIGQQIQWFHGSPILTPMGALYQTANGIIFNTTLSGGLGWDVTHAAWVKVIPGSDNFENWHIVGNSGQPAYAANFASGATFGTYQSLQFRSDAQNNLHVEGAFHATTAVSGGQVFTLPIGYRPKLARNITLACENSSGTILAKSGLLQINSNGVVNLHISSAAAIGESYHFNAVIPLGDIA